MKSKLLTAGFLILASLQVACDDDNNGTAQACAKDPACWQRYASPQSVKAIAGPGATYGLPQVANELQGTNVQKGQVPNPEVIPASILEAKQKQIASTLQAIDDDPDYALTHGANALLPAGTNYVPSSVSGGSSSAGEITVARVQSAEPEPQREPTAYVAPQAADPNSVFAQPEALGSR